MTTSKVDEDPQTVDQKNKKNINIEKKPIFIAGYCIFKHLVHSKG